MHDNFMNDIWQKASEAACKKYIYNHLRQQKLPVKLNNETTKALK